MDSSVHGSLHPNCHHQIVYSKLNLKIEYPPLYERLVWDYNKTNTQFLNRTIETFNCEIKIEFPPLYEQLIWDYNKTNTQLLNRTIATFS